MAKFDLQAVNTKRIIELQAQNAELLSLLKDALSWAKSVEGQHISAGLTDTPDSLFSEIKHAIAKAEGNG